MAYFSRLLGAIMSNESSRSIHAETRTNAAVSRDHGNVLVVMPQPFYQDRGTPIALRHVLEALSQLGYAIDVLTFPGGHTLALPGVRWRRTPNPLGFRTIPIGLSLKKLVLDVLLMWQLRQLLRRHHYRCVHVVEEAAFFAAVLCRSHGTFLLYDMHASLPEQLAQHVAFRSRPVQALCRRLERWLLSHMDAVVCSTGLAEHVHAIAPNTPVHEWHFPSAPPAVLPEEVAALRDELYLPESARIVLYTGTFETYQGLSVLIDAIPRVIAAVPEAVFMLVGAATDAELALMRASISPAIRHHVLLLPRQPRARMPRLLVLADLLVSPRTHGGNCPLKIFDYLAAGKPIVATDIPAHRAVLDEHRAVLIPPSAEALAQAIADMLLDPQRAARLGTAACAYATERLTWPTFVTALGAVYEQMHGSAYPQRTA